MKLLKLILLVIILMPSLAQAKPQVYFDYKIYYTPDNAPYIEMLLMFNCGSLKFVGNEAGNLTSKMEVTQIFKLNDSIVLADKYVVNSPEMLDSTIENYYDVKRFQLAAGNYDYEIIIKDLNNDESISANQSIFIDDVNTSKVAVSSIGFVQSVVKTDEKSSFVKNGYFILPYLQSYFPPVNDKIMAYFELYNTKSMLGENEKFMITFEVEDYQTERKVDNVFKVQKFTAANIVPVIPILPIELLPSGEYNLVVSVLNKAGENMVTKKVFFERRSDIVDDRAIFDRFWILGDKLAEIKIGICCSLR